MATGKPKKHFAHDRVSSRIFQSNTPNPKITFTNAGDQWETTAVTVDFEAFSTLLSETGMNWKCGIGKLTSVPHHTVISRFTSAASSFMSTHKWQQSNLEQKLALSEIDRTSQGKNTRELLSWKRLLAHIHANGYGHIHANHWSTMYIIVMRSVSYCVNFYHAYINIS